MGASPSASLEIIAGRQADRGNGWRYVCCGTLLLVVCFGCRSAGITSNTVSATDDEDVSPRRKPAVSRAVSWIKPAKTSPAPKRSTTSTTPDESPGSEESSPEDVAVDEVDEEEAETPETPRMAKIRRERLSSVDEKTHVNAIFKSEDPPSTESLIEILGFDDQPPSHSADSPRKKRTPRPLPGDLNDLTRSLQLTISPDIPGATAPPLSLPETDDNPEHIRQKMRAIDILFPRPSDPKTIEMPHDRVMTLEELEDLALENSPIIGQSLAGTTMSQGTAFQAGVYPNPVVGYEADTVGSFNTRNYQGVFLSQQIKTAGKLGLARAAANMEVANSQLALERTKLEVLHMVRANFYNVLVAQESIRINDALLRFTNRVYMTMVERLKGGEQAGYELSQFKSLVVQARVVLRQSQNQYIAAWKQLAAATGVPELQPARLQGPVDMTVPNFNFDDLLARVLNVHPDLTASRNLEAQSRLQLKFQQAIPIPDLTVSTAIQNDFTQPGFQHTAYNLDVSVPVPIFDRNLGNIRNAQGKVHQSSLQYAVTKNQLTQLLSDAVYRYQTARYQAQNSREQILPDLARAYLGVYEAHISNFSEVAFGDIIVAQQGLTNGVAIYLNTLSVQWLALTDIANLIQLRDFRELFVGGSLHVESSVDEIPPAAKQEGTQP